ncbi:tRNA pseudouridine(55) synthase TruB [Corynebacterium sp. 3HC-13]|uniref:tRNA pseudouridine(55) synthase TruB n=1 Tax=Corynebacterium poyangense TaxID=2684405 RepID=UPI001CCDCDDC|nr:tRNA pseudouridine(55) synthase TruB [Corynebacterium poyangense]MBZ8178014.1 tRNA pseudouridine(55) synthase TruB [Corynebacterium poyangense]
MPVANSGLVVVDKPAGMTSHHVVSRLRRIYRTRKIGHAGTLDPMATGVLVAGVNRGTKFLAHLGAAEKSYHARVRLGVSTSTEDAEGEIITTASSEALSALTDHDILETLTKFRGDIQQRPSAVSAIKINGKRAYQRVRDGEDVELPSRPITIFDLHADNFNREHGVIDCGLQVHCSSGTYIRALARDIGDALGVGGHLIALRRTAVGVFSLADASTLEELESAEHPPLVSLDEALPRCYPPLAVDTEQARKLSLGQRLSPRGLSGIHSAIDPQGHAVALVQETAESLRTVFVARPATL